MNLLPTEREPDATIGWMLKKGPAPGQIVDIDRRLDDEEAFEHIRCPLCGWQPTPSSTWCCEAAGTPEPLFEGCGTTWNTFSTRGRCPGCAHQWRWTSCLRCEGWSLHDAWYEESRGR
jgi:hypothetical protein